MLRIAAAQIAPVVLDRAATTQKIVEWISRAADEHCRLVAFGESLVPAYPFWLSRTDGARFDHPDQKRLHARYLEQGVAIDDGHLEPVQAAARDAGLTVVLGIAERAVDRGGHTIYCSRVVIDEFGRIASVHRKLVPTYEERLSWGTGDGAGLITHRVGEFVMGALNCWENWMPLARATLYAGGENLHVALWPGARRLTQDSTRFIALESRSYVVSVSGLIREQDLPSDLPLRDCMVDSGETVYDGGSCIAAPDGSWLVEPIVDREGLLIGELDLDRVYQERQNFDPVGHYARPDVFRLTVDRRRQTPAVFLDDPS